MNDDTPNDAFKLPPFPQIKDIELNKFESIRIIDESFNQTGTHKDRMASMLYFYIKKNKNIKSLSILSSGSAALAIYDMIRRCSLNVDLNILIDPNKIERKYQELFSKIISPKVKLFEADLTSKKLNSQSILNLTKNPNGTDLTFWTGMGDFKYNLYRTLIETALEFEPDYCFIPFGSGDLYFNFIRNWISMNKKGNSKKCHFLGATTSDKFSNCSKLYAPFPFHAMHKTRKLLTSYREQELLSIRSNIYEINNESLKDAMEIAKDHNIECEHSGIGGLALFLEQRHMIKQNSKILIINTGRVKTEKFL